MATRIPPEGQSETRPMPENAEAVPLPENAEPVPLPENAEAVPLPENAEVVGPGGPEIPELGGSTPAPTAEQLKAGVTTSLDEWLFGINAIIADTLDDVGTGPASVALSPFGINLPQDSIRQVFADRGYTTPPGQEPATMPFSIGHIMGSALLMGMLTPAASSIRAATSQAMRGLRGVPSAFREGLRLAGETAVRRPVSTMTMELGSAALAGAAEFEARKRFPDSEAAQVIAGILGGTAPGVAAAAMPGAGRGALAVARRLPTPIGITTRVTEGAIRIGAAKIREITTVSGARLRARRRMERAVEDPEAAIRRLEEPGTLPEAELTPAQKARDPGLLALERSVIDESDELRIQSDRQLVELNRAIRQSLEADPADVEATRETFEQAQDYLRALLDSRLRLAALEADRRIAALGPDADDAAANTIARAEIDEALRLSRATERQLYEALPSDTNVLAEVAIDRLRNEIARRGRTADPEDVPAFIREFLGGRRPPTADGDEIPDEALDFQPGRLANGATFDELRVLRSRVLREVREEEAKTAPNRNKIRILEDISDALLADLSTAEGTLVGPDAEGALRAALNFSRDLNERFSRGIVGRLRGRERRGGPTTPPELTLHASLGMRGPRAATNARQLLDAVRDNPEPLAAAASDFIKGRFLATATRNGRVDPRRAENFLAQNKPLLDEFPQVRADIEQAVASENTRNLVERRAERIGSRLANPRVSKATLFIQREPAAAFEQIRASRPRNRRREITNLINMTNRDTTGEALNGLRVAFTDWLLRRSTIAATDASGRKIVSGARLRDALDEAAVQEISEQLLTDAQRNRLEQTVETALAFDAARAARPSVEGVIGDKPSVLWENLARVGILRVAGRAMGGFSELQTPNMISNRVRDLIRSRVKDPAGRLISDAIVNDEELFQALLTDLVSPEAQREVNRRINAWLAGVLFESGLPPQGIQERETQQPRPQETDRPPPPRGLPTLPPPIPPTRAF